MMELHCWETTEKEITACVDNTLLQDRVLKNMLRTEHRCVLSMNVLIVQKEITETMIEIVGGWMMEVSYSGRRYLNFKYLSPSASITG